MMSLLETYFALSRVILALISDPPSWKSFSVSASELALLKMNSVLSKQIFALLKLICNPEAELELFEVIGCC